MFRLPGDRRVQRRPALWVELDMCRVRQKLVHLRLESADRFILAQQQIRIGSENRRNANRAVAFGGDQPAQPIHIVLVDGGAAGKQHAHRHVVGQRRAIRRHCHRHAQHVGHAEDARTGHGRQFAQAVAIRQLCFAEANAVKLLEQFHLRQVGRHDQCDGFRIPI